MSRQKPATFLILAFPLAGAVACSSPCEVEATANPNARTVISLDWTTSEAASETWVEYGDSADAMTHSTPVDATGGTEHSAAILGLPAFSDVFYQVVSMVDGEEQVCTGEASNLGLPSDLPSVDVTIYDETKAWDAPYVLVAGLGEPNGIFIIDREGEVVWYREGDEDIHSDAGFSLDSNDLYFNTFSEDHSIDIGTITRYSMTGEVVEEIRTEAGHHGFTELPDGTLAFMQVVVEDWVNPNTGVSESVVGDAIVEIAPDGTNTEIWNSWDWAEPVQHTAFYNNFYPQGADWTHANALTYDEDTGAYTFSLGNLDIVLEIDRASGEVLRQFGGNVNYPGGYTFAEGSHEFDFQHDTQWTDDGTLIMSNRFSTYGKSTGTIEYSVDDTTQELTEVWRFGEDQGYYAVALGQGRRLPNGNTMVNFGSAGLIQEVTSDGEIVWELSAGAGAFFGSASIFQDIYTGE